MVKITFEVDEDFIIENASLNKMVPGLKNMNGFQAVTSIFEAIAYRQLSELMSEGKKEFTVTPDKLDAKNLMLYTSCIGEICMMAVSTEKEKTVSK